MTKTTCDTVRPELKAYLDGMLSWPAAYRVRRHLFNCDGCRRELAEIDRVGKELQNMATDLSADGDKLDPLLRARILAAIPSEASTVASHPQTPIRRRPAMVVGAMAATILTAAIIFSRRQVLSPTTAAYPNALSKGSMSDQAVSRTPSDTGFAAKSVTEGIPSMAARPKIIAASPLQSDDSTLYESSTVSRDRKGTQETHTFTTQNLKQGVILVRQAVNSFQGTITKQSRTTDADAVELTINIPSSLSAAFVGAIPSILSEALHSQNSSAPISKHGYRAARGNNTADLMDQVNARTEGKVKEQIPRFAANSGTAQTRAAAAPSQSNDRARASVSMSKTTMADSGSSATTTITIVLLKKR